MSGYTFDWSVVLSHSHQLLGGAWTDIWVTSISFALACVVGLSLALLRLSRIPLLPTLAFIYVQIVRGIPLYVLLLWLYFGLAEVTGIKFSAAQAMITALILVGSGYTAEIFRASIESIDAGQVEAARAVGLFPARVYAHVVLPQAWRVAIAPLGNIFIALFKGATIMSLIAVRDMVFAAQDMNVTYFTPFEAFTAVAIILVILVWFFSGLTSLLEASLRLP